MSNLNLPDIGATMPAPHHHPGQPTEVAAAQLVTPRAGTLRESAIVALYRCRKVTALKGGLTDHELADVTDTYLYSIAPRRVELLHLGWVVDSGHRRRTPRGSQAIVWCLAPGAEGQAATIVRLAEDTQSKVSLIRRNP